MARGLPHESLLLFPEVNAAEACFVELFELLCVSMLNRLATHLILALGALGCGSGRPHVIFLLGASFQRLFVQITFIGFVILVDGQITVWKLLIIFFAFLFPPWKFFATRITLVSKAPFLGKLNSASDGLLGPLLSQGLLAAGVCADCIRRIVHLVCAQSRIVDAIISMVSQRHRHGLSLLLQLD